MSSPTLRHELSAQLFVDIRQIETRGRCCVESSVRSATRRMETFARIARRKLPSIDDRGQTDRVTTPTRAGLRRCRWLRPRHAARLAALQWKPATAAIRQYSQDAAVYTLLVQTIFALTFDLDL